MNNKDFIAELAQQTGYSADDTQNFVNSIVEAMPASMKRKLW